MASISLSRVRQLQLVYRRFSTNPCFSVNPQYDAHVSNANGDYADQTIPYTSGSKQFASKQPSQFGSRSQIVQQKLAELKARSTITKPWCLKCGCPGHLIKNCRNAQRCFLCNGFGHKAFHCNKTLRVPPPQKIPNPRSGDKPKVAPVRRPQPTGSLPNLRSSAKPKFVPLRPRRTSQPSSPSSPMAFRPPIVEFEATPRSQAVEARLLKSFVLDDIAAWGPEKIERQLQATFPHENHVWIAALFDDFKYLIQAPTTAWLESMASIGFLRLDRIRFPIVAWERDFHEGMNLDQIWVRVYGYPLFLNEKREYEKLFNPWGAYVLEIDAGTDSGYDVRFIRVKLEICDRSLIPLKHLMPYRKPNGQRKLYDLEFEIESDKSETLNAWAGRKEGRPYPNGTAFGQNPPPAGAQQPPPPAQPPQGDGGFVFNGSELVLQNTSRIVATETPHVDALANGDMQGETMENVEQGDADTEALEGDAEQNDNTEDGVDGDEQQPTVIAGDFQFPAIEGFPAVPFPWTISLPPCSQCGYEGIDDFLIPTDETTFPPYQTWTMIVMKILP